MRWYDPSTWFGTKARTAETPDDDPRTDVTLGPEWESGDTPSIQNPDTCPVCGEDYLFEVVILKGELAYNGGVAHAKETRGPWYIHTEEP